MNKAIVWVVILVAVLLGVYWTMSDTVTAPADGTEPVPAETGTPGSNMLLAGEQMPGKEVLVSRSVLATGGGTIVVHKNVAGEAGEAIGTVTLGTGTFENVTVPLSEATKSGESVHVMLHADLNNDGLYSVEEEGSILLDAELNPINFMVKVK